MCARIDREEEEERAMEMERRLLFGIRCLVVGSFVVSNSLEQKEEEEPRTQR